MASRLYEGELVITAINQMQTGEMLSNAEETGKCSRGVDSGWLHSDEGAHGYSYSLLASDDKIASHLENEPLHHGT